MFGNHEQSLLGKICRKFFLILQNYWGSVINGFIVCIYILFKMPESHESYLAFLSIKNNLLQNFMNLYTSVTQKDFNEN